MRIIHMCLDIEGFLSQARRDPQVAAGIFKGKTAEQAISILEENLAIGRRVLPFGPCEGFDYRTGCPGHESTQADKEGGVIAKCGTCQYLPLPDSGGYAWCPVYPGHWNPDYQRYTGGYCNVESPACTEFKRKDPQ